MTLPITSETHPEGLRTRLIALWLELCDMATVQEAGRKLGVSHVSVVKWLSGENEPSELHLAMMAGYHGEGEMGLTWQMNPALHMAGYSAGQSRMSTEWLLRIAVASIDPNKQAVWRLFELALLSGVGYQFGDVEFIDWRERSIRRAGTPRMRRYKSLWLPANPLHLACPVPILAPKDVAPEPLTEGNSNTVGQYAFKPKDMFGLKRR